MHFLKPVFHSHYPDSISGEDYGTLLYKQASKAWIKWPVQVLSGSFCWKQVENEDFLRYGPQPSHLSSGFAAVYPNPARFFKQRSLIVDLVIESHKYLVTSHKQALEKEPLVAQCAELAFWLNAAWMSYFSSKWGMKFKPCLTLVIRNFLLLFKTGHAVSIYACWTIWVWTISILFQFQLNFNTVSKLFQHWANKHQWHSIAVPRV